MKFNEKSNSTATLPATGPNLRASHRATIITRRRVWKLNFTRQRRSGVPVRRRIRLETPLLKWNQNRERCGAIEDDVYEDDDKLDKWRKISSQERRRNVRPDTVRTVAAGMWRLQVPDAGSNGGEKRSKDELGFQGSAAPAGHLGPPFLNHHDHKHFGFQSNKLRNKHSSVAATKNGFLCKHEPSIPFPRFAMEEATKWDPIFLDARDEIHQIYSNVKRIDQQVNPISLASSIELKLEEARACIEDLEGEKRSQKKKIEQFLSKVSEERGVWRSREHEKVRAIINDMKADMKREKKTRQRLETVNQNLVNELADSKLAVKRYMHDYQKERKARELMEEVCDELVKEIEEDKAEVEALKSESMNLREEVDDERRMLQMAEVWREERVQMKLIDAKVTLEDKYSQMNKLVGDLESFLKSRNATTGVREAELLRETAASVNNAQETKGFTYEPANPDDIFMLFEEMNLGEAQDREIEECVACSPVRHSNAFTDGSGWETVSHLEEHESCYSSPDESARCINENDHRGSNVSLNGREYQEIREMCSVPRRESKKVLGNRGGMKGCIEWPRGAHKNSFKTKIIEAQIESQKVQLKHVLEHKM